MLDWIEVKFSFQISTFEKHFSDSLKTYFDISVVYWKRYIAAKIQRYFYRRSHYIWKQNLGIVEMQFFNEKVLFRLLRLYTG